MSKIVLTAIGSDPEAFLFAEGKPVSAIGLVPGSKEEPYKISEHESVQVDNVAIEFNIKPTLDPQEFINSLNHCADWMVDHLRKVNPLIEVRFVSSVEFDPDQLKSRAARMFGCDPDFCAWDGAVNRRPSSNTLLRSCGGHIHLGIEDSKDLDVLRLIRLMDQHVGMYTSAICGDKRRMELYGKAGAFREKPYGVEYRTPSNTWLSDPEYVKEVFERTKMAVEAYNEGKDADYTVMALLNGADVETIRDIVFEQQLV